MMPGFSKTGRNNFEKITFFMAIRRIEFNIYLSVRKKTTE